MMFHVERVLLKFVDIFDKNQAVLKGVLRKDLIPPLFKLGSTKGCFT